MRGDLEFKEKSTLNLLSTKQPRCAMYVALKGSGRLWKKVLGDREMNKWKPAKVKGKPVMQVMVVPVAFKLG